MTATMSPSRSRSIATKLSQWFDAHQRPLPFRQRPEPYRIWVSEVMLQQTQMSTVLPYFERFIQRFPRLESLAQADDDELYAAWQGLGYYSRARNLKRAAQLVCERHQGKLPRRIDQLRALPGIGPYTAGAIASLAFGLPEPVVDGNVERVLARLQALGGNPKKEPTRTMIWALARQLANLGDPRLINQGLMELGALVCTPREPSCTSCPLVRSCRAKELGATERFPESAPRQSPEVLRGAILLLWQRGRIGLEKQSPKARHWAGLYALPNAVCQGKERPEAAARRVIADLGLPNLELHQLGTEQYSITRFRFRAEIWTAELGAAKPKTSRKLLWQKPGDSTSVALPAPHRRVALRYAREKQERA